MKVANRHWLIDQKMTAKPWWLQRYAGATCALATKNKGEFEIFISGRDHLNRSVIGSAYWNIDEPSLLYSFSTDPLLDLGPLGSFFDSGTSYPNVFQYGEDIFMIFTGWQRGVTVPFYNNIGISKYDAEKEKFIPCNYYPLLPPSNLEFTGTGSSSIKFENGMFSLYYTSFKEWNLRGGVPVHEYSIRKRVTSDPLNWSSESVEIKLDVDNRLKNICKPTFLEEKMFFCARPTDGDYSIFYATLDDERATLFQVNELHIDPKSVIDQDDVGQAYPTGITDGNKQFIIYSGNNYGKSGLGVLELCDA